MISLSHLFSYDTWRSLLCIVLLFRFLSYPALVYHILHSYTFSLPYSTLPQSLALWSSYIEFLSILQHTKLLLISKFSNMVVSPLPKTFFLQHSPSTFTLWIFIISGLSLDVIFYQKPLSDSLAHWYLLTSHFINLYFPFRALSILLLTDYLLVCLPN